MMRRFRRSFKRYFVSFVTVAILAFLVAWLEHVNAERFDGVPRVVDGDSLQMGEEKVRLVGIDAPELRQVCQKEAKDYRCGAVAREHLQSLVQGQVECVSEGTDKYGRTLAECFSGDKSLNAQMVLAGWAVAYGGYGWQEAQARLGGRGLWAGDFDMPQEWRIIHGELSDIGNGAFWRGSWRRISNYFQGLMGGSS